eukprot:6068736-Pleurochrysis_carterae.AAC.1
MALSIDRSRFCRWTGVAAHRQRWLCRWTRRRSGTAYWRCISLASSGHLAESVDTKLYTWT